jgi:hypothetical protein
MAIKLPFSPSPLCTVVVVLPGVDYCCRRISLLRPWMTMPPGETRHMCGGLMGAIWGGGYGVW